jgi:hypothetical protein
MWWSTSRTNHSIKLSSTSRRMESNSFRSPVMNRGCGVRQEPKTQRVTSSACTGPAAIAYVLLGELRPSPLLTGRASAWLRRVSFHS